MDPGRAFFPTVCTAPLVSCKAKRKTKSEEALITKWASLREDTVRTNPRIHDAADAWPNEREQAAAVRAPPVHGCLSYILRTLSGSLSRVEICT